MWRKLLGSDWATAETRLKAIREGLLIVALFIGGGWTIFHFMTSESNAAKERLDRLISENKAIGLQGKLDIRSRAGADARCVLIGQVSLQNYWPDKVDVQIDLEMPIEISPVEFVDGGSFVKLGPTQKMWISDIGGVIREPATVVPGRTVVLPFAAEVAKPGLYLVRFRAPVTRIDDHPLTLEEERSLPAPSALRPIPKNYSMKRGANSWSERQIVDACPPSNVPGITTRPNTNETVPIAGAAATS